MFIGHYAVALATKKADPKTNLGFGFFACQFLDLIWPLFVILGMESVRVDYSATQVTPFDFHYPYSHSLIMSLLWSVIIGGAFYFFTKRKRSAVILGLVVFSHWILDFATHRADMPLTLHGTAKVGLGLWNFVGATLIIESLMFFAGIYVYVKNNFSTHTKKQKMGFIGLMVFLYIIYLGNMFGPKPPLEASPIMLAGPALALWLMIPWAWAVDRQK